MRKLISLIKNNWKHPVWSSVFAGIILAILANVAISIKSLINNIPFSQVWNSSICYLSNNKIQITYLTASIAIIIILAIVIPMVLFGILKFKLRNRKVSESIDLKGFNLETFINGRWKCEYKRQGEITGGEYLEIKEGNKYFLNNKIYFVLTDISFDKKNETLKWSKMNLSTFNKHSTETLKIVSNDELKGSDDQGYIINYIRLK